ncbi:MAG: ComF family protein [Candidatus Omnitrophica bacterium]|nr:ComF family protein [Candidatus Omnitrophota bacterium]
MISNGPPVCTRCGKEIRAAYDALLTCHSCRTRVWAFEAAAAPWQYRRSGQLAVRAFKYQNRWRIGHWLAQAMVEKACREIPLEEIEWVIPVPRHWLKVRFTGRQPAANLGSAIAQILQKPFKPDFLSLHRWTRSQTHLSPIQRRRNVQDAFQAKAEVCGHTVLLVDDVFTSGSTAQACAQALRCAGAKAVFVLTAACTAEAEP